MAKALFLSLPLHGHTNPSLPLVRELVGRGDAVIYYSTDTFGEKIAQTGARYRPYRNEFLADLRHRGRIDYQRAQGFSLRRLFCVGIGKFRDGNLDLAHIPLDEIGQFVEGVSRHGLGHLLSYISGYGAR